MERKTLNMAFQSCLHVLFVLNVFVVVGRTQAVVYDDLQGWQITRNSRSRMKGRPTLIVDPFVFLKFGATQVLFEVQM